MKHSFWLFGALAGIGLGLVGCGGTNQGGTNGVGQGDIGDGVVTEALTEDLQFLREEEKLARDVYTTLYGKWHLIQHNNISRSEQTHTTRVAATLTSLGLEDPVQDDSVGVFVNPEFGKLYTDLVATGQQGETQSLEVGATIEDLDIRDIEQMKGRTDDAGVLAMYGSLQCGSRNHLRAYTSQLAVRGVTYTPKYLSQADFDAIVAGSHERCGP